MDLADILAERSVLICRDTVSKGQLFDLLARAAAGASGHDPQVILDALIEREALGSTGVGNGIAIPHGKVPGLMGVTAVFARLAHPIDFDAMDDQPVDLVTALIAPVGSGADHLKALACVARLMRTETLVEAVRSAPDARTIHALLTGGAEESFAA